MLQSILDYLQLIGDSITRTFDSIGMMIQSFVDGRVALQSVLDLMPTFIIIVLTTVLSVMALKLVLSFGAK